MKLSFWGRLATLTCSAALILTVSCANPETPASSSTGGTGTTSTSGTSTGTGTTVAVTGITLNKVSTALVVGGTEQLAATVAPTGATNKNVTWTSSASSVASVSTSGLVKAVSAGTATITATTADGGKTATCTVTVSTTSVAVTGVALNKASTTLAVGGTEQLTATITPTGATNQNLTWTSSASSVASVSTSGLVTAAASGTATITATTVDGGKTAICTVTVGAAADTSQLGFESGFDKNTVTFDDNNVLAGTSMGMTFSLDTAQVYAGASSLNCTGTSQKNRYSTDFFGEASIPMNTTTGIDFTSKPIYVSVYVPTGSKVVAINVSLIDAAGKQSMRNQQNTKPGTWTTLKFNDGTDNGYADAGAVITTVKSLRFRFETTADGTVTGTAASAPVNVNLDKVNW